LASVSSFFSCVKTNHHCIVGGVEEKILVSLLYWDKVALSQQ
jgi:hypothetical protein